MRNSLLLLAVAVAAMATVNAKLDCRVRVGYWEADLSKVPVASFTMEQQYQGSRSYHIFQFSLCTPTTIPPTGANVCNKNSYVGEWATNGMCENQFNESIDVVYNESAFVFHYYNPENAWSAVVSLTCGTSELQANGAVTVDERLRFNVPLSSKYACPPKTCTVETPNGRVDLSSIPERSLVGNQVYRGQSTEHVFRFSLCTPTTNPPPSAENCHATSYVGEWGTDGTCEAQFTNLASAPSYDSGANAIMMEFYNMAGWTTTIELHCGTSELSLDSDVSVNEQLKFSMRMSSKYACSGTPAPTGPSCVVAGPGYTMDLSRIKETSLPIVVYQGAMRSNRTFRFSLCSLSLAPPPRMDFCGVKSYVGEWSSYGACGAQFVRAYSPYLVGDHVVMQYAGVAGITAQVELSCGTEELEALAPVVVDATGQNYAINLTSKHVCSPHPGPQCKVKTPFGTVDLSSIPQSTFSLMQRFQGVDTSHLVKFNLCSASTVPPPGAETCDVKSYVGEWSTNYKCEAQFDQLLAQPYYDNGRFVFKYYNSNGWAMQVTVQCGSADLSPVSGVTVSDDLQFFVEVASKYACTNANRHK